MDLRLSNAFAYVFQTRKYLTVDNHYAAADVTAITFKF
jgi:hypothetical protein